MEKKLPPGLEVINDQIHLCFYADKARYFENLKLAQTEDNIKHAYALLLQIRQDIKNKTFSLSHYFPKATPDERPHPSQIEAMTLSDLVQAFLDYKRPDVRSSTLTRYMYVLNVCVHLYPGDPRLSQLTKREMSQWRTKIIEGKAARGANTYLTLINEFMTFGFEYDYLTQKFPKMKKIKKPQLDPDPFTPEEFQRLLAYCLQDQHRNLLILLAYTGLRTGEMCALAWEDIDLKEGTMLVSRATDSNGRQHEAYGIEKLKTTKSDKSRLIYLHPPVIEALTNQKAITFMQPPQEVHIELSDKTLLNETVRFVFTSTLSARSSANPWLSRTNLLNFWTSLCRRAGIRQRRMYQLRHTYASWMLTAGANMAYLAEQMGHANFQMIATIYGKWLPSKSKREHDKAWGALQEITDGLDLHSPYQRLRHE
ncbi:TPA: tyrosine-type recombinase/integrase [Photobacterium damselae]